MSMAVPVGLLISLFIIVVGFILYLLYEKIREYFFYKKINKILNHLFDIN